MSRSIAEVLADPAASRWLKGALSSALDRDPVDAERDALELARLLTVRLVELELARPIDEGAWEPESSAFKHRWQTNPEGT